MNQKKEKQKKKQNEIQPLNEKDMIDDNISILFSTLNCLNKINII